MSHTKVLTAATVLVALATLPSTAFAERGDRGHRGRAVPRGSVRAVRPPARVIAPNYYGGYRGYRPGFNLGFFYGRPGYYGSHLYNSPFYGYGFPAYLNPYVYPAYGYGYGYAPHGYGYGGYSGQPYGGLRIDLPQRDAEVYVDGYFAGAVDDFDGAFQQANLEAGPHRIEVRASGFEALEFDVRVEPGRTITYRGSMRPY